LWGSKVKIEKLEVFLVDIGSQKDTPSKDRLRQKNDPFAAWWSAGINGFVQEQNPGQAKTAVSSNSVDWEDIIPRLRTILKKAFPRERIEQDSPIRIVQTVDITGDGTEALVYLGTGGSATDEETVVRMQNDRLWRSSDEQTESITPNVRARIFSCLFLDNRYAAREWNLFSGCS
jgi:hypothetical protein